MHDITRTIQMLYKGKCLTTYISLFPAKREFVLMIKTSKTVSPTDVPVR